MPMRRSLTILNSIRDLTMVRGQVVDNVGQRSPWSIPGGNDDACVSRGEVIDNVGQ